MFTKTKATALEHWRSFIACHVENAKNEYRRDHERRYINQGSVSLVFEADGETVERTGALLNLSEGGLMIKQYVEIPRGTPIQLVVLIDDDKLALAGRAVHSTQTLGGYKIGVELTFDD